MAVIDFPTSPINGQIFNAPNGVTYRWQSTPAPGLWLSGSGVASVSAGTTPPTSPAPNALWWNSDAITGGGQLYVYYNDGNTTQWVPAATGSLPTTPGGDFCATGTGGTTPVGAYAILIPTTVNSGNASGSYSTSTGRYTPPAGRFNIFASLSSNTGGGGGTIIYFALFKNGVELNYTATAQVVPSSGQIGTVTLQATLDANGTDIFDVRAQSSAGTPAIQSMSFGAFPVSGIKGPSGDPGVGLLQTVSYQTGAVATGTTVLPNDDTIPQIGEGNEYMTLAITPRSATSKLIIEAVWNGASNTGTAGNMAVALFQDSTANALAIVSTSYSAGHVVSLKLTHTMTSGTTSATTFRVRAGASGAGTTTFNGTGGARSYGGVMASSIVIQEVL